MLPNASCAFDIPNVNDDLELHCRLYFPQELQIHGHVLISGFAIVAHPYASLGGSYDDPIVQTVGSILLKQGYVLCTFNFRGAAGSPGNTSWTGKGELADYVSVYTFMLHLMSDSELLNHVSLVDGKPLLILGGYSYGSMIAQHMPDYETIKEANISGQNSSADAEIETKAEGITKELLAYLETQVSRGHAGLQVEDNTRLPNSTRGIMVGGYESENAHRRISRDSSRRSVDIERVRHSVDRVRNKFSKRDSLVRGDERAKKHSSRRSLEFTFTIEPSVAYLLISPLLQPITGITTVFSRLTFEKRNSTTSPGEKKSIVQNLTENPTLAIYGDKDVFTSARRLHKWSQHLQGMPNSRFSAEEVLNAGHFWHEDGAARQLRSKINDWLNSLTKQSGDSMAPRQQNPQTPNV